jgi:anaerobic selenocysteine-containing dehydrogenase
MRQGLDRSRTARSSAAIDPAAVRDSRNGPLRPTDWDDALDRIVAGITRAQNAYGRDSVGCFGGGGLTNEKAYQFGNLPGSHSARRPSTTTARRPGGGFRRAAPGKRRRKG